MSWPRVGWSNCRERGMRGLMELCSFQSSLMKNSFYFAQEPVSLSSACTRRSLASRYFLLPSRLGLKQLHQQLAMGTGRWLNGLGSPFGIETRLGLPVKLQSYQGLNGLGSPFGIETVLVQVAEEGYERAKWPGEPVW